MTVDAISGSVDDGPVRKLRPPRPVTLHVGADGRVLDATLVGLGASAGHQTPYLGTGQPFPLLRAGAVQVGDTWTSRFQQAMPTAAAPIAYTVHSGLLRYEQHDGTRVAVLTDAVTLPMHL